MHKTSKILWVLTTLNDCFDIILRTYQCDVIYMRCRYLAWSSFFRHLCKTYKNNHDIYNETQTQNIQNLHKIAIHFIFIKIRK